MSQRLVNVNLLKGPQSAMEVLMGSKEMLDLTTQMKERPKPGVPEKYGVRARDGSPLYKKSHQADEEVRK